MTPIFVYTNYPEAELFINGKSQGRQRKDRSIKIEDTENEDSQKAFTRQKRYRLMWMDTKYEPGEVKVVAYDDAGKAVATQTVRTAGRAHHLELSADRTTISPDGKDISFVTVRVVDKDAFHLPRHHVFSGQLVALVQSAERAGEAVLTVSAKGLPSASIRIQVK